MKLIAVVGLTLLLSACATLQSAALPMVAAFTPSVEATEIVSGPPSGAMFEVAAQAVRGPWSEARIAQARADDAFSAFSAFFKASSRSAWDAARRRAVSLSWSFTA